MGEVKGRRRRVLQIALRGEVTPKKAQSALHIRETAYLASAYTVAAVPTASLSTAALPGTGRGTPQHNSPPLTLHPRGANLPLSHPVRAHTGAHAHA